MEKKKEQKILQRLHEEVEATSLSDNQSLRSSDQTS